MTPEQLLCIHRPHTVHKVQVSLVENFLEHPRQIDSGDTFFGAIFKIFF